MTSIDAIKLFLRCNTCGTLLLCAVIGVAGCGKARYPVTGKIVYDDGAAYTAGGIVSLEGLIKGKTVMTRAAIRSDGTFTTDPGSSSGAVAGRYRIRLTPARPEDPPLPDDPDVQPAPPKERSSRGRPELPFDKKFLSCETSGLEWTVGRGGNAGELVISLGQRRTPRED